MKKKNTRIHAKDTDSSPGNRIGRRRFLRETARGLFFVSLAPVLSRCGGDLPSGGGVPADPEGNFYFAVISDTHVVNKETSIQNEVFALTVEMLNAFSPALDFVVATGDVLDYLPSDDAAYYDENHTGLDRLRGITSGLRMPLHLVMGNHDYYTGGEIIHKLTTRKVEREQLYRDRLGMPGPWHAFDHRGVKFCCLNSMQNDPAVGWNPNAVGCFGPEQAAWLGEELGDGKPAFLFHHHPLATEMTTTAGFSAFVPFEVPRADGNFRKYQGTPLEDYTDPVYGLLRARGDQIRASFFGHSHLFLRDTFEGIPIFMTDSMQFPSHSEYDGKAMRFQVVECRSGTGDFTVYNAYMIKYWKEDGGTPLERELDPALFT